MSICQYIPCVMGVFEGQKRLLDPLELQALVDCLIWMLGTEL